jgi:hypothetical protein
MKKIIAFSALTLSSLTAQADVRINGFANLIAGMTTSSDESVYGYDDKLSFSEESLFAVQVSADINSKMTATAQLVARGSEDYNPDFEWAYLSYEATDNVSISAGRLRLPLFRYSTSLDVGYSYHWVNAPKSVYDVPFNNLDGLRIDYNNYSGDWEYNFQFAFGTYENETASYYVKGDNTVVVSGELVYNFFKMRAVYGRSSSTLDVFALEPVFAQLQQVLPADLYNDLVQNEDTGEFLGLGLEVDKSDWFLSAEITTVDTKNSYLRKDVAYYVTAGLRYGKYTPSITYEVKNSDDAFKFTDKISQLPSSLQQSLYGIQTVLDDDEKAITIGVRYDFDTNVAFKADATKYTDNLVEANDATLVRFAVNYVF